MRRRALPVVLAAAALIIVPRLAVAKQMPGQGVEMPDVRRMSGTPLPSSELAPGTVTVRVIRGSIANPLPKQTVTISGAAAASGETNDAGRAEFTGLPIGARIKATVTVDGETIDSQEFAVPAAGGIRLMLVATDPETAKREEEDRKLAAGPARPGVVVFGDQSRFVFELGEEGLNVFNILEIQNTARVPVSPSVPIVFDLPAEAEHASLLDGSSPLAALAGQRITVAGPFPPGVTLVQFAYTMQISGGAVSVTQRLPAALAQVSLIAQKVGDVRLSSPQASQQREMNAEGRPYIVAQGPPLAAGADITVSFTGLPHAPVWPRNLAVGLAVIILLGGAYAAAQGRTTGVGHERSRLEAERERLFQQLTNLEASHRSGSIAPDAYAARRGDLVVALERVYAALDEGVAA